MSWKLNFQEHMGWYKEYKEQYWIIEFTRDFELGGFEEGRAHGWKKLCI